MKTFWSMAAALLAGTTVIAQQAQTTESRPAEDTTLLPGVEQSLSADQGRISVFQKASTFLGMDVQSEKSGSLGKVVDLVFDPEKGKIAYVVIEIERGEGQRKVPVPLRALKPAEGQKHLVLNMSEPLLAAAPGVTADDFPPLDAFAVDESEAGIGGSARSEKGSASSENVTPQRKVRTTPAAPGSRKPLDAERE